MVKLVKDRRGSLNGSEEVDMTEAAKKVKTTAAVFELPQKLGILQYVEYEPPPREWCTSDGCLYEGLLTAEGCRRGICVKYRVWVHSRDKRRWEAGRGGGGGMRRRAVASGNRWLTRLWELSSQYDVGVWYRKVTEKVGIRYEVHVYCGVEINGVRLDQPTAARQRNALRKY
jgi:hypothetical protein